MPAPQIREEVLQLVRKRVLAFASSRAGRDEAEDIAQETLLLLTTKYPHLDQAADLVPLSMRIARLKLMNHWRKKRRASLVDLRPGEAGLESVAGDDDTEAEVSTKLLLDQMLKAIDQLGDRCRHLLLLKLEGRDFSEIQQRMSAASINTVYTWDSRCRKQLRAALAPAWGGDARG